jgi:hypothetical protein
VEFKRQVVVSAERNCERCGGALYVRDTKHRYVWSLDGPKHLTVQVLQCHDPRCELCGVTVGTEAELSVAMPYWCMSWDLFAWMGHKRYARHWSIPQLLEELDDRFGIQVSFDMVGRYLAQYQRMVAGRQADMRLLAAEYEGIPRPPLLCAGLRSSSRRRWMWHPVPE